MGRAGLRALLVFGWVSFALVTALAARAGQPQDLPDSCLTEPVVALALDLDRAGDPEGATEVLLAQKQATVANPASAESTATPISAELDRCLDLALDNVAQHTFSDRVADGIGDAVASLPWLDDLDPARAALSDGTITTIQFLLWFVPLLLFLLTIREILVTWADRRPGPVNVVEVTIDDQASPSSKADLRRALKRINLDPSSKTPGGIGEIVLPVVEASSSGPNWLKTLAQLAKHLVVPESGFNVECRLSDSERGHTCSVVVLARRDGQVVRTTEVSAATRSAAIKRAASEAFFAVHRHGPVRKRTASWSQWSDGDLLAQYIDLPRGATSSQIKPFVRDEPGNLAVRLQYARALSDESEPLEIALTTAMRATRTLLEEHGVDNLEAWRTVEQVLARDDVAALDDAPKDAIRNLLTAELEHRHAAADAAFDALTAAIGAVRRSPRLAEPRFRLAIALAFCPSLHAADSESAAAQRARSALLALRKAHPFAVGVWDERFRFADRRDHLWIALGVSRRVTWSLRLPATMWRRIRYRRLRRSIPWRSLLPFNSSRRAAIHNMASIALYARLSTPREPQLDPPMFSGWSRRVHLIRLGWLRVRHRMLPDTVRDGSTAYNMLLCAAYLHPPRDIDQSPQSRVRGTQARLEPFIFDLSTITTKAHLGRLHSDADLQWHQAEIEHWLGDADLQHETIEDSVDWERIAAQQVAVWRKQMSELMKFEYSRPAQWERLLAVEEQMKNDAEVLTKTSKDEPNGCPSVPDVQRISDAIVSGNRGLRRAELRELARDRLREWTQFHEALTSDSP